MGRVNRVADEFYGMVQLKSRPYFFSKQTHSKLSLF